MNINCHKTTVSRPLRFALIGSLAIFLVAVGYAQESPPVETAGQGQGTQSQAAGKKKPLGIDEILFSEEERAALRGKGRNKQVAGDAKLPQVSDDALQAFGIRKLTSKHLILYTDLPRDPFVDEIPRVFDLAVGQWAEYFDVPKENIAGWKIAGSLIKSKEKFLKAGLLPKDLPPFLNGYQRGREFWVYEQDSAYYRRHLVLHEGVHGFMFAKLGGAGPPWYREGIAEFLATHRWKDRKLRSGYMPYAREEVPYWGRIRILKKEYLTGRPLMLREVMRLDSEAHLKIEPYAWCWAAAAFLDGNLRFQKEFRKLRGNVGNDTAFFTRDFEAALRTQARELDEEWQLFIANMDYGYDFRRNAVRYKLGTPLRATGTEKIKSRTVTISTDLGWQSTGVRMEQGKEYVVAAEGRFRLRTHPKDWWSEPGGITIEYANGLPLGVLIGNIRRDEPLPGASGLVRPIPIGKSRGLKAGGDGTLYLRINESAAGLSDNSGQITVKIIEGKAGALKPANKNAALYE